MNETPLQPELLTAYEFSVGKYTPAGDRAREWKFLRISVEDYEDAAEAQKVTPVLVMKSITGKRWWWYLDRFYWEDENLTSSRVHGRVLLLERRVQADRERAALRAAEPSETTVALDVTTTRV